MDFVKLDLLIAQLINFGIIFLIFKTFLGDFILKEIETRRELMKKIKNAENEYDEKMKLAEEEYQKMIDEAKEHKKNMIHEGHIQAEKEKNSIIENANKKADSIREAAEGEVSKLKKDLKENWETGVKSTSKLVLQKLFEKDPEIKDEYLSKILFEIEN